MSDFKACQISAYALAKMSTAAAKGGANEVMGLVLGDVDGDAFIVRDAFALPVEASETRVNAMGEAYEYIVQYMDSLKRSNRSDKVVGWYHSHPGYRPFLSQIDIGTQSQNQQFQDPFVALVIDPLHTAQTGVVDIGAFRTSADDAEGFHALRVSYFTNPLDAPLLTMTDPTTWARTLTRDIPQ